MKKMSDLLKKVDVFEKMAMYGDRKSFLSSLAQVDPTAINDDSTAVRYSLTGLRNALQTWIATSGENQQDIPTGLPGLPQAMRAPAQVVMQATQDGQFDLDTLPKIYLAVRNLAAVANLGDMGEQAKSAWMKKVFPEATHTLDVVGKQIQQLKSFREENSFPDMPEKDSDIAGEQPQMSEKAPAKMYPYIPRDVQEQLSKIVSVDGVGLPIKRIDGQIGPETRAALNAFKQKFNVPGNLTDAQVFDAIRGAYSRDSERYA